jgi:predicted N-acetyltransferase YhbS
MDTSFSVRLQRPEDDAGIVEVLRAAFGRWPKIDAGVPAIDHLRWKKSNDPESAEYNCVAIADGRIVGAQAYWIQDVKIGARILRDAQGIDFCVHPDYQGHGIRTAMKKLAYETVELTTEFAISVDGDHPAMVHMVSKVNDERFELANKVNILDAPVPSRPRAHPAPARLSVREAAQFDERADEFCSAASEPFQMIFVRTQASLNWRYADRRAGAYTIYLAEEGDRLLGYATARASEGRGYLADLLALPDRLDAARELLRAAFAGFASAAATTAECWSPIHHPYQAVLSEAGFSSKRRTRPIRARPRGATVDPVDFRDNPRALIHLSSGDCDVA